MTKKLFHVFSMLIVLLSIAQPLAATPSHNKIVVLDQSQDIFFDQLPANAYALEILGIKNKFSHNLFIIGGSVESDLQHWQGDKILTTPLENYRNGTGIYLTQATIDLMLNMTNWATIFLSGSGLNLGQGGETGNYLYSPHAFINIGNLERFPVYLTVGINNIPFGVFTGTGTWDTPLTSAYFNSQQSPQVNLGFYKSNINFNALTFIDQVNYEYHFATSLSYKNMLDKLAYNMGAGFLTNLKTNSTGNVATTKSRKNITVIESLGNVWDINASAGYKLVSLAAEFLAGSHILTPAAHKPAAYSATLSITPTLFSEVTTFAMNYSASFNFNNIPTTLPGQDATALTASGIKNAFAMSVSRPFFIKNIVLGLDAQRVVTYNNLQTYAYTLDLLIYI